MTLPPLEDCEGIRATDDLGRSIVSIVWRDPGQSWQQAIEEGLRGRRLLGFLTPNEKASLYRGFASGLLRPNGSR